MIRFAAPDMSSFNQVCSLVLLSSNFEELPLFRVTIDDLRSFGPALDINCSLSEFVIKLCITAIYGFKLTISIFLGPYLFKKKQINEVQQITIIHINQPA